MTIETDGLSEKDFREMAAKLEAARAMLAALRGVENYFRSMDAENPEGQVLRAIAQAEAAGIAITITES